MSRMSYLARRLVEIPPQVLARKLWLRAKPRLYARGYARARKRGPDLPADDVVGRVSHILAQLASHPDRPAAPGYRLRAERRAAAALAGRFTVLGYGETDIPHGDGWRCDPFHGHRWTDDYFPRVDFLAAGTRCDVKIPWELSRLQYLPWLAEGARLGGPDSNACLARFEAILSDWIASNPAGFGVNWACGMEVAIRAVNLVFAAALVADRLSVPAKAMLVRSLLDHRDFLHRFPEYSDVSGNHYLADLMGIAVLDAALDGPDSRAFARSVAQFAAEAERQFDPSGCHLEYSTVYHRLCMDILAHVHALATQAGAAVAQPVAAVLKRAMRFADAVASPGGLLPIFGDCDSGHILWFGADARRLDAMRAYCRGDTSESREGDLATFLANFRHHYAPLYAESPAESGLFGPFVTMRRGALSLIARHGPQGLQGRAPHDHDDAMGFWVFLGDEDLFVDIGCLGYTLDADDRRASIVSTGHPVWSPAGAARYAPIDGSVFVTVRGAAHAEVGMLATDERIVCDLELRGELGCSVAERRRFILATAPDGTELLVIEDHIRLDEPAAMEMTLRLGPGFVASTGESGARIKIMRPDGTKACQLLLSGASALDTRITQDIWAPQYGRREPISAIRMRSDCAMIHGASLTVACVDLGEARILKEIKGTA